MLLNNLGKNMSAHIYHFEEQFSKLNQKEKVEFAKNLLNHVDEATDFLTLSMNTWFRRINKSRTNDDLEGFEQAEIKLNNVQKEDAAFSKSKIKNLTPLKEIDLEKVNALTPEMEKGINQFAKEYCSAVFKLNEVSSNHINKGLFYNSNKITINYGALKTQKIIEQANKEFDEGVKNLKQKNKNILRK